MISARRELLLPRPYIGPGDIVPGATGFWGVNAYSAAYARQRGAAFNFRRTSDNATYTAYFLPNGRLDHGAIAAWAGGSGIAVSQAYDHTGNGNHLTQGTAGNQPTLNISPTYLSLAASGVALSQSVTPSNSVMTFTAVANRSAGTGAISFIRNAGTSNGNRLGTTATVNAWRLAGGAANGFSPSAADAAWHAGVGVENAASSVANIDGTETTGTATGDTTAGTRSVIGAASTTMLWREAGLWEALAMSADQRKALVANMIVRLRQTGLV